MNTTFAAFPPKVSVLPRFSADFGDESPATAVFMLVNKPCTSLQQTFDSLGRRKAVESAAIIDENQGLKPTFAVGRWLD